MAGLRGYKQSPEHIAKRIKSGPEHQNWVGDEVSVRGGRTRALRRYPDGPCQSCGHPKGERHHVDDNTANNEPSNIRILCRRCHMTEDGRLARLVANAPASIQAAIAAAAIARSARTKCKRDHPLSGANLYVTPDGKRVCKECRKIHKLNYLKRGESS